MTEYVSWIDGQQAMHEAVRRTRNWRETGRCCTQAEGPCPACEREAEGRKADREEAS